MKEFLGKNRIVLGIAVGGLAIGTLAWFGRFSPTPELGLRLSSTPTPLASGACANIPDLADSSLKLVTKVIDGDTFLIEGGYSLRVLGLDADERGYPCYEAAKNKLEELVLNKEVKLEKSLEDKDQWCRYLRYVFEGDKNISLELVKEGLAVARFSPEDIKYREEITLAEKGAKENKIGCKWSASVPLSGAAADKSFDEKAEFSWEKLTPEATNLKIIGACQVGDYYNKEMIVEGKVVDAFRSKTNTVFLNFEKAYPNHCFTGVIFSSNQYKFIQSPEKYYSQKTVRIKGEIKEYQGKPEIILAEPSQIEIGK